MAKEFYGAVSSTAADKTIVVTVNTSKTHPLYRKKYMVSKKFAAHDEKNEARVGDMVVITETRPISKRKRFVLARIEKKAAVKHVETATPAENVEANVKGEGPAKTANTRSATGATPEGEK